MKTWVSAAGTVLLTFAAAIISPIVVERWQERDRASAQVLEVSQIGPIGMSLPLLEAAATKAPNGEMKIFHQLLLTNSGADDLYNVDIELVGDNGSAITDVGGVFGLDEAQAPKAILRDGRVQLRLQTLKKEETVVLWVLNTNSSAIAVRSNAKGLNITDDHPVSTGDSDLTTLLLILASIFVGLVAGVAIAEIMNRHVLTAIGFDPKEIARIYAEAMKSKEKK